MGVIVVRSENHFSPVLPPCLYNPKSLPKESFLNKRLASGYNLPMAGSSKRPLAEKLGLKPGQNIFLHNLPQSYKMELADWLKEVKLSEQLTYPTDFIHFFT